jgi:hypothetical protein
MTPYIPPAWEIEELKRIRRIREREDREVLQIPVVDHICPVPAASVPSRNEATVTVTLRIL